jgi:multimeric flavodoxin WrbA
MAEPVLTREGQEILDSVVNMPYTTLPFVRERLREKYLRIISLVMAEQGVKEASKELVIEAIRTVEGDRFNYMFRMREDPGMYKRLLVDPNINMEAYYAMPRQVKRWVLPQTKPTKRPDEMKVLAFNASPRVGGNTDVLIDETLRGARDAGANSVEKIILQKIKLNFCIGCEKCRGVGWEGFCSQKDDANVLFQKMADSDAIIIGFPIYMGRQCGQLCTFFDRWYCLSKEKLGAGKRGLVIGTWGAAIVDAFDSMVESVMNMLNNRGIEPVEALSASGFEGILHGFDDKRKAIILRFPDELEKAYQAGKTLITG